MPSHHERRMWFDGLALLFLIIVLGLLTTPWQSFFPKITAATPTLDWRDRFLAVRKERQSIAIHSSAAATPLGQLGRRLFFDKNLSPAGTISCASCHDPSRAFTDGRATAVGVGTAARNSPTLLNSIYNTWQFWDGRATHLASQALGPIENPKEHGFSRGALLRLVLKDYPELFADWDPSTVKDMRAWLGQHPDARGVPTAKPLHLDPFVATLAVASLGKLTWHQEIMSASAAATLTPGGFYSQSLEPKEMPSGENSDAIDRGFYRVGQALEAWVGTLVSFESPFDAFVEKYDPEKSEPTFVEGFGASEWSGLQLFYGKAKCADCHRGVRFTDDSFHNIGLADAAKSWRDVDLGRARGLLEAISNPFNCMEQEKATEACQELAFADVKNGENLGAFKTPSLRFASMTAPYMHNGSLATLEDVLKHYETLPDKNVVGHRTEALQKLSLTEVERRDLLAFVRSLSPRQMPVF